MEKATPTLVQSKQIMPFHQKSREMGTKKKETWLEKKITNKKRHRDFPIWKNPKKKEERKKKRKGSVRFPPWSQKEERQGETYERKKVVKH